jgi:hypothetical protein
MNQGYQAVVDHFTTNDWKFELDEENQVLQAGYTGDNAQFRCAVTINEDDDVCQCFAILPAVVPQDKRLAIAELCVRASYAMKIGNFEFDMDDGEIRFHAGAPYPAGKLDDSVIRHLVAVSLLMTDRYYPAFMSVLFAGVSPKDAVLAAEQTLQDSNGA